MKTVFRQKLAGIVARDHVLRMLASDYGRDLYRLYAEKLSRLPPEEGGVYTPLFRGYDEFPLLYRELSKARIYEEHYAGPGWKVVVGVGEGHEFHRILTDPARRVQWFLVDPTLPESPVSDTALIGASFAAGYEPGLLKFHRTHNLDGSSAMDTAAEYLKETRTVRVGTVDNLSLNGVALLTVDAEGMGLDALAGAYKTITRDWPDLIVGIYHNRCEYHKVIPYLYDLGYTVDLFMATSLLPQAPNAEMTVFATRRGTPVLRDR